MRRIAWIIAALCLTTTSIMAAQRTDQQVPAPPHESGHETVLLRGCLAAGTNPSTFKLTKASLVPSPVPATSPGAASSQAPVVGTSGAVATSEQTEFQLRAERRLDTSSVPADDIQKLVGHQVEVTARPPEAPPPEAPKAESQGKEQTPSGKVEPAPEPLTVTAIKSVQATCR
jgi:hypothetical protein